MHNELREYINSGEYFLDSRKWYYNKYISPISHRSLLLVITSFLLLLLIILAININSLLPLVRQLKYAIYVSGGAEKIANVRHAISMNTPLNSILKIMIEGYVSQRERYDYTDLEKQIKYVHKTSNRVSFNQFYNYLNIDNTNSPILRYQQEAKRYINITKTVFLDESSAEVHFISTAVDNRGNSFENLSWISTISFDSDKIDLNVPNGTNFRFIITDYKLKLVGDNNARK